MYEVASFIHEKLKVVVNLVLTLFSGSTTGTTCMQEYLLHLLYCSLSLILVS